MLSRIFVKLNNLKRISFIDKNIKKYINLNKTIFNNKTHSKSKINAIVLVDLFDWNPFIFFWSILTNFLKKKGEQISISK